MRLVFMGSPAFAVPVLQQLIDAGHDIAAVYSQPPRPARRGKKQQLTPVHAAAEATGIPVHTPAGLKNPQAQAEFAALKPDAAIVVAYGLLLPKPVLETPRHGCYNLHASLLPRWRGAAPIHRAIMAGDGKTGVCVMRMEQGLDTGPVWRCHEVAIGPTMTTGELHDILAGEGASLMAEAMSVLERDGTLDCRPQPDQGVTYAAKIDKQEAAIDFSRPAQEVASHVNGLSPWPGAWFIDDSGPEAVRIKVLRAEATDGSGPPGQVLDDEMTIACGARALRPLTLQREGKAALPREAFLRGHAIPRGTVLAQPVV